MKNKTLEPFKKSLLFLAFVVVFSVGFETRVLIEEYNKQYEEEENKTTKVEKEIEELEWRILNLESKNSWLQNRLNEVEENVRR